MLCLDTPSSGTRMSSPDMDSAAFQPHEAALYGPDLDKASVFRRAVFSAKDSCRQRGPPSVMRMQSGSNRTVATRLEELEDLLRQGLINKEERETKRADILSSL